MKATKALLLVCLIVATVRLNQAKTLSVRAADDNDLKLAEFSAFKRDWDIMKESVGKMNEKIQNVFKHLKVNQLPANYHNTESKVDHVNGAKITSDTSVWKHKSKHSEGVALHQRKVTKGNGKFGEEQYLSSSFKGTLQGHGNKALELQKEDNGEELNNEQQKQDHGDEPDKID